MRTTEDGCDARIRKMRETLSRSLSSSGLLAYEIKGNDCGEYMLISEGAIIKKELD